MYYLWDVFPNYLTERPANNCRFEGETRHFSFHGQPIYIVCILIMPVVVGLVDHIKPDKDKTGQSGCEPD